MRQGAVGTVRLVERDGRRLVEKRLSDPARHDTEVRALRALADSGLPVPQVVEERAGVILMTELPGGRLDEGDADTRLAALRASAVLLRRLHDLVAPEDLPPAPDDAAIIARYRAADGPALPLAIPPSAGVVFCHGDWTDGNVLGRTAASPVSSTGRPRTRAIRCASCPARHGAPRARIPARPMR